MQGKEASPEFVQSVTMHEGTGAIDLFRLLGEGVIKGRLTGVQIASHDSALSAFELGRLANRAFSIFPIPPENFRVSTDSFAKEDLKFAAQFGYTPVPHFACLKMIDRVGIEAWISPVLLSPNHPLTHARTLAAALFTDTRSPSRQSPSFSSIELPVLSFRKLKYGRYVRLTVLDKPRVLGNVARAFGDQKISIKMMEQPKPKTENPFAEMAFILYPCLGEDFATALSKIRELKELKVGDGRKRRKLCRAINTVLPIV